MKGSIEYAKTFILILIALVITLFIVYLIIFKNLIPSIIEKLKFVVRVFQGIP